MQVENASVILDCESPKSAVSKPPTMMIYPQIVIPNAERSGLDDAMPSVSGVSLIDFPHFGQCPVVPIFSAVTFSFTPQEQVTRGMVIPFGVSW